MEHPQRCLYRNALTVGNGHPKLTPTDQTLKPHTAQRCSSPGRRRSSVSATSDLPRRTDVPRTHAEKLSHGLGGVAKPGPPVLTPEPSPSAPPRPEGSSGLAADSGRVPLPARGRRASAQQQRYAGAGSRREQTSCHSTTGRTYNGPQSGP